MATPTPLPPQLTARAIVLAVVLAMILAAANTYLGLFAGMTIASAIPAAVVLPEYITHHLGEGLLRAVDFQESIAQSLFSGLVEYFHPPS